MLVIPNRFQDAQVITGLAVDQNFTAVTTQVNVTGLSHLNFNPTAAIPNNRLELPRARCALTSCLREFNQATTPGVIYPAGVTYRGMFGAWPHFAEFPQSPINLAAHDGEVGERNILPRAQWAVLSSVQARIDSLTNGINAWPGAGTDAINVVVASRSALQGWTTTALGVQWANPAGAGPLPNVIATAALTAHPPCDYFEINANLVFAGVGPFRTLHQLVVTLWFTMSHVA